MILGPLSLRGGIRSEVESELDLAEVVESGSPRCILELVGAEDVDL